VKYSPAEAHVSIDVDLEDGDAVIQVADQGIGIPDDELPRVFERLYRASNAVDLRYPGTGLGLSIVLATALGHGGTAAAEKNPAGGTVVTIRLPVQDSTRSRTRG
jgi:signal transduction histidine kinase